MSPLLPVTVLGGYGSVRRCAFALHSGRSPFLDAAFRSAAPRTGLATDPRNCVNVPGLHLRNDPQTRSGPFGATLPSPVRLLLVSRGTIHVRNPLPEPISGLTIRLQTFAPLWDLSIPRDQHFGLTCEPVKLTLAGRPIFLRSPRRGNNFLFSLGATDHCSGSATSCQARYPSNLLEPHSSCSQSNSASTVKACFPQNLTPLECVDYGGTMWSSCE